MTLNAFPLESTVRRVTIDDIILEVLELYKVNAGESVTLASLQCHSPWDLAMKVSGNFFAKSTYRICGRE